MSVILNTTHPLQPVIPGVPEWFPHAPHRKTHYCLHLKTEWCSVGGGMRVFPEQANVLSTLGVCATHPLPVSNQKPAAAPDRTTAASTRDLPGLLFAC